MLGKETTMFNHNPDVNPNWTPLVARRVYACNQCGTEQVISTNHTGTVWAQRCVGKCRTIANAHTAREIVSPYYGPHHFVARNERKPPMKGTTFGDTVRLLRALIRTEEARAAHAKASHAPGLADDYARRALELRRALATIKRA
jgi:purine nucleoside phosphorylase